MSVSAADLATHLNAPPDDPALAGILDEATALVDGHLGPTGRQNCPASIKDLAIKEVGSALWSRRNAGPGGVAQWIDGQPVRLARDPLSAVRRMLWPFRSLGPVG